MGASLEIEQDERFQRAEYRWQRWGWGVLGLIVAAAALGLTGARGLVDRTRATTSAFEVEMPRFTRLERPTELSVKVLQGEHRELKLSGDFIRSMELQSILPEPDRVTTDQEGLTLSWDEETPAPRFVIARVAVTDAGRFELRISTPDGSSATGPILVWP